MNLISIPAFDTNYIWLLCDQRQHCLIIDPGTADPVLRKLQALELIPEAILLTHHHADHTGGVGTLLQHYPDLIVYGPEETRNKGAQVILGEGDHITFSKHQVSVMCLPGHTAGHIVYSIPPYLFCGDVLFSAGCGRLYHQDAAAQQYQSLLRIQQLPDDTLICCAHEYTLDNLKFALTILPEDPKIKAYYYKILQKRNKQEVSLPSTLQTEKSINLFLRCHEIDLQKILGFNTEKGEVEQVFSLLRQRKDNF